MGGDEAVIGDIIAYLGGAATVACFQGDGKGEDGADTEDREEAGKLWNGFHEVEGDLFNLPDLLGEELDAGKAQFIWEGDMRIL